jgi:type I restriction enzyme M protein
VQDPAAGTAGFLIAADAFIKARTDNLYDLPKSAQFQRNAPSSAWSWSPAPAAWR